MFAVVENSCDFFSDLLLEMIRNEYEYIFMCTLYFKEMTGHEFRLTMFCIC